MKLTSEQKLAVDCPDDLMLTACPGSGKTRVIISKLSRAVDAIRGTPRVAGCITYTNTAVHEIETRLRQHSQVGDEENYDVCTIHSFCLNHIFRPFCHRIEGYENGFEVITPDSEQFNEYASAASADFNRYNLTFREFEEFSLLQISEAGEPFGSVLDTGTIRREEALRFWQRLRNDGRADFSLILYHSLSLMRDHPEIVEFVASRFSHILIDEFQDTTELQIAILGLIAERGRTNFFMVGDPNQSIFGFAGARPDLADIFADEVGARTDLVLTGNFRSSEPIIEHAERIIARNPPMTAVGPARLFTEVPEYENGATAFAVITETFLPRLQGLGIPIGNAAILAPSWFTLFPLGRRLREFGVSIVGPGARPYRRNRLFAPLAEQICGHLMNPTAESIIGIERSLFNLFLDATGKRRYDVFTYEGRVLVFRLVAEASRLQEIHMGAMDWLTQAATVFSGILIELSFFGTAHRDLLSDSVTEMEADMRNTRVDVANLTVDELGVYSNGDAALKLSSLHNSKGREYDAVAMIDLHQGKIPNYRANTPEAIAEARRLFYVGITRARHYLLYSTDRADRRNIPTQFLRADGVRMV
ncbi:UvrD-helicase domain-containing protein [Mesorhizobium japonicum]|uniref:DNA 3'-5' helicase n=1 Tax=Mesorhizobium japonicum (strain LMG 29417 / CECT 9101 / MAFF 303099) TaxID=266835 RepID=Q983V0_RHILO|nr:ATP-dependent helicase [Mesorhizobium japonicum]BAB53780.1 ATP-dependent DNA helicase [Mesorhizobium japonicum MAFF 303099]